MVLSLVASWGDCGGGLAPRVSSFKELMALPCTMQSCRLMKNCGRAPRVFMCTICPHHNALMGSCSPNAPTLAQKCQSSSRASLLVSAENLRLAVPTPQRTVPSSPTLLSKLWGPLLINHGTLPPLSTTYERMRHIHRYTPNDDFCVLPSP